jgi:purine-binding chemotaxis protein CheW
MKPISYASEEAVMGALVKSGGRQAAAAVGGEEQNQYLTFLLGGEMFAIGILNIKEIIEYGSLTEVPMMPEFIRGVINLRGAVVPVVDLSARFGRKRTEVTRRTCIVIIEVDTEGDKHDVGVVVDSVSEVLEIAAADIEPAPSFGTHIRADFIAGMGKVNGKFVIILSVNNVLSLDDLALLDASAADATLLAAQPV